MGTPNHTDRGERERPGPPGYRFWNIPRSVWLIVIVLAAATFLVRGSCGPSYVSVQGGGVEVAQRGLAKTGSTQASSLEVVEQRGCVL